MIMYILGGILGFKLLPRLFMALAGLFQFKLIIIAYAGFLSTISIVVLFPLLVGAIIYLVDNHNLKGMLFVAISSALCLLTGEFQLIYYGSLLLVIYVVVILVKLIRSDNSSQAWQIILHGLGGAALGVGIAAIVILPLLGEAEIVFRQSTTYDFFMYNHGFTAKQLLTYINPELLGSPLKQDYPGHELWEDAAYFGLIPLFLFLISLVMAWRVRGESPG